MDVLRCRKTDVRKMKASPDSKDGSGWMKSQECRTYRLRKGLVITSVQEYRAHKL
jgi:hypothetical protein